MTQNNLDLNPANMDWLRGKDRSKVEFCKTLSRIGSPEFAIAAKKTRELAPYFVNLAPLISFPNEFQRSIDVLRKIIETEIGVEKFSRMAAASTKVLPHVAVLTHILEIPMLFIKKSETKGRTRRIDGILYPGDKVLVIDDIISTGRTAIEATEKLRAEGALVENFVALLDNERGGRKRLKDNGLTLYTFITIREVADYLEKMLIITTAQRKTIYDWVKKSGA